MQNLPSPQSDWAYFLDVDGTLVDLALTPFAVRAEPPLFALLSHLMNATDGAVALVTGRPMKGLDTLLAPLRLPAAGMHGLERRDAQGRYRPPASEVWTAGALAPEALDGIRRRFRAFADASPGVMMEDKGWTLALHFREAPEQEASVRALAAEALAADGHHLQLLECKMALEVRPFGIDKGTAIEAFCSEAPFAGRLQVFAGDDISDEDGFLAVNRMGGISIRVGNAGEQTAARFQVPTVAHLHDWLNAVPFAPRIMPTAASAARACQL